MLVLLVAYGLPLLGTLASGANSVIPASTGELLQLALQTTLLIIGLVLCLQVAVLREPLSALSGGPGPLWPDLRRAGLLVLLLFAGAYATQWLVSRLTGAETPEVLLELGQACREDPLMLAVMLGPVVWIQAALTEELARAFILRRIGKLWPGSGGRLAGLCAISGIFGLAHMYQGIGGILVTLVIGLLLGGAYLRQGRLLPLVLAHGIYDSLVLLGLVYGQPQA